MINKKASLKFIFLLVLPAALGDLMSNVYNAYIPIFLQAGNPIFANSRILTNGFGMGPFMVGFWMVADNLLALILQPIVGAWSDRIRTRWGRRIPFVLGTLPLIIAGYAIIPVIPGLIPDAANGQISRITGLFLLFTLGCVVYYLGFMPVRLIMQTLRQEAVRADQRSTVEAWYTFFMNLFTIGAFTLGAQLYKLHGPLLFWVILGIYVISCLVLVLLYKEPFVIQTDNKPETSNLKQLAAVFQSETPTQNRNLFLYLASVLFITLSLGGSANFMTSWVVQVIGVNEAQAASILSITTIASTLAVLPAGYLAAGKFGRKKTYLIGILTMAVGAVLMIVMPGLYIASFVLLGIGTGTALSSMLALLFDVSPHKEVSGALVGIYNVAYMIGFIFGSLIVGWVIEMTSYDALFPTIFILGISSALCVILIKFKSNPNKLKF